MSPPPTNIDGTDITGATIDGQEVQEITVDGQTVFTAGPDIPDSVVSRDDDDQTNGNSDKRGIKITTHTEWPSIGATLSQNVSGVSEAQIIRLSDSTILDTVDISGLSAGDSFTFDNVNLAVNSDFSIIAWDKGNGHTSGQDGSQQNFPYTSNDVDIVNGIKKGTTATNFPSNIITVGNVGF